MKNMIMYQDSSLDIKKFKDTELYYQSTYELDFLELCESIGIIHKVRNGNTYYYINKIGGLLTDFCIGNYEIEIKSTYIMEK